MNNITNNKSGIADTILSLIFCIMLSVLLFVLVSTITGCKPKKDNKNLNETVSDVIDESVENSEAAKGKMYSVTNSWYKYKTVDKLVTEVYEKDKLVVKNEYDADGYRVKKTAGDIVTTFKYDKRYKLIKEVCINNKSGTHTLNYTYELLHSDIKGPRYKLTGFTYNGKTYTFKYRIFSDIIISIYDGENCIAVYEDDKDNNGITRIAYEIIDNKKVKNDNPDFIGNLNRVLYENQYYYDDETGMSINKNLRWYSAYGSMNYYEREYETQANTPIVWTPSNGDRYVYNDNGDIEKIVNGDKVIAEYKYEKHEIYGKYSRTFYRLTEKICGNNIVKYDYFTGDEDIAEGKYFWSDLYMAKNNLTEDDIDYKDLKSEFEGKLKSISTIINGKEHKITYKYGYPIEPESLGEGYSSLKVSGFSYNGRNYKFEFLRYESNLITGIVDDKGNKIAEYIIENKDDLYYSRNTYEINGGTGVINTEPDFIGNLNLIVCDEIIYDTDCGVNFDAIRYKR